VVFRNQARGTENKGKKEFVNVLSRFFLSLRTLLTGSFRIYFARISTSASW